MPHRDIVVIGASAGGISATNELLCALSPDLDAALFVVLHVSPEGGTRLPDVLRRGNRWHVEYAIDGARWRHRRVYLAPPDHHLLVKPARVQVVRGPRENRFRPAIDPLFRSAAVHHGPRVIGCVLSGALDDGTHGLELIKRHGGVAVVQDPEEAIASGMPLSAIHHVEVDHILRLSDLAARLPGLVAEPVAAAPLVTQPKRAPDVAEGTAHNQWRRDGTLTEFTCPECGGSLRELEHGSVLRFRCHVGHVYTADHLRADQIAGLDNVFWSTLRALEEQSMLRRRMSQFAVLSGRRHAARLLEREARAIELRASASRRILHIEPPAQTKAQPVASVARAPHPRRGNRAKMRRTKTRRVNR